MRQEMEQKMLLQLHEQYAVNNNAYMGSVIPLIVAMLGVFYAYGVVYVNSTLQYAQNYESLYKDGTYALDVLIFVTSISVCVMAVLFLICLKRGSVQRKEQFIIYAIRYRYFEELRCKKDGLPYGDSIFPEGYDPFGKGLCGFVQGPYNLLMNVFVVSAAVIIILTILKITMNIDGIYCAETIIVMVLSALSCVIGVICCICVFKEKYEEYKNTEKAYAYCRPRHVKKHICCLLLR